MYKEFYNLTTCPFALAHDSRFLYLSKNFKTCLYHLLHGIAQKHGFFVLTGDRGTGKTFLLHNLVKLLNDETHVIFLAHLTSDAFDILQYISQELRMEISGDSQKELLRSLNEILVKNTITGKRFILTIDEAQYLSVDILDELRMLSNLGDKKNLPQIILSGQRQLEDILKQSQPVWLSQYVDFSCTLLPMDYYETESYIKTRLLVAGATYPIFTSKAMKEVFRCSKGIPRVINRLCHLALLFGCTHRERKIRPAIIQQVIQESRVAPQERSLSLSPSPRQNATGTQTHRFLPPRRPTLVASLAAVSLLSAGIVLQSSLPRDTLRAYTTRAVPGPFLPHRPGGHDLPLLPHRPGEHDPAQNVLWKSTTISYQLPTGKPWMVSLLQLQHPQNDVAVQVMLEASDRTPEWLTFDPETFILRGTAPLTEAGKTYHLIFRARTADGLESSLHLTLTLLAQQGLLDTDEPGHVSWRNS
jgi:type II secretory pathway predicted ATPase ExeA